MNGATELRADGVSKTFTLHQQGGTRLAVLDRISLSARGGECVALCGPSGVGKTTLLRALYGNYRIDSGRITVRAGGRETLLDAAAPREVLALRRATLGYVSQFLRVIPRVPALQLVAEPLRRSGVPEAGARARAGELLTRLNVPRRLWELAPATFSGGEQQRVNIARGLAVDYPILLLDEPTASLDAANRDVVVELLLASKRRGAALVGIFHDAAVRAAVADSELPLT